MLIHIYMQKDIYININKNFYVLSQWTFLQFKFTHVDNHSLSTF